MRWKAGEKGLLFGFEPYTLDAGQRSLFEAISAGRLLSDTKYNTHIENVAFVGINRNNLETKEKSRCVGLRTLLLGVPSSRGNKLLERSELFAQ